MKATNMAMMSSENILDVFSTTVWWFALLVLNFTKDRYAMHTICHSIVTIKSNVIKHKNTQYLL